MTKKTLGKRALSLAASAAIVLTSFSGQLPAMSRTWAAADGVSSDCDGRSYVRSRNYKGL